LPDSKTWQEKRLNIQNSLIRKKEKNLMSLFMAKGWLYHYFIGMIFVLLAGFWHLDNHLVE